MQWRGYESDCQIRDECIKYVPVMHYRAVSIIDRPRLILDHHFVWFKESRTSRQEMAK